VLVREPDQLRVERKHPQLAFAVRLVELAEPDRHVAADDDRTPADLDDDHELLPGLRLVPALGHTSVMPVSTSTRASGCSMTCT
jgi:hypothetical protein